MAQQNEYQLSCEINRHTTKHMFARVCGISASLEGYGNGDQHCPMGCVSWKGLHLLTDTAKLLNAAFSNAMPFFNQLWLVKIWIMSHHPTRTDPYFL